jgi:hypothetical protein
VDGAVTAEQRADQSDGGLRVVRPAALAEQLGFAGQARVPVQLQQLRLDLRDPLPPGGRPGLLPHDLVVAVEVAQVVGGDGGLPAQQFGGEHDLRGELGQVAGEQFGEAVDAVDVGRALPGQVVEADVVQDHRLRCHAEQPGEPALEADRHVAQADGPVSGVEQGPGDDADRVGEVDDPGVRRGQCPDAFGDVEDDRHGPQRLGQPARPGGLLADAAALQREGLVGDARRLPADA